MRANGLPEFEALRPLVPRFSRATAAVLAAHAKAEADRPARPARTRSWGNELHPRSGLPLPPDRAALRRRRWLANRLRRPKAKTSDDPVSLSNEAWRWRQGLTNQEHRALAQLLDRADWSNPRRLRTVEPPPPPVAAVVRAAYERLPIDLQITSGQLLRAAVAASGGRHDYQELENRAKPCCRLTTGPACACAPASPPVKRPTTLATPATPAGTPPPPTPPPLRLPPSPFRRILPRRLPPRLPLPTLPTRPRPRLAPPPRLPPPAAAGAVGDHTPLVKTLAYSPPMLPPAHQTPSSLSYPPLPGAGTTVDGQAMTAEHICFSFPGRRVYCRSWHTLVGAEHHEAAMPPAIYFVFDDLAATLVFEAADPAPRQRCWGDYLAGRLALVEHQAGICRVQIRQANWEDDFLRPYPPPTEPVP